MTPGAATTARHRAPRRRRTALLAAVLTLVAAVATMVGITSAQAAAEHTVTFVNSTGEKIWIGSTVNADGSVNFARLPILESGAQATITIPENSAPNVWRGKFFARQGCTGTSGADFHCAVGDCGAFEDHCTTGEQPVSLAEFNFDPADPYGAPWYDVSYVNAVNFPITMQPTGATPSGSQCAEAGCPGSLLNLCPAEDLQAGGKVCVNPNRDSGSTSYVTAIKGACPKAYAYSTQDREPGNQTMYNCPQCNGFTVTFHGNGTAAEPASTPAPAGTTTGPAPAPTPAETTGPQTTQPQTTQPQTAQPQPTQPQTTQPPVTQPTSGNPWNHGGRRGGH